MPYDPELVRPMRAELTDIGVQELLNQADVDGFFGSEEGTAFVVVNSVCGCAAGGARPAVRMAMQHTAVPQRVATVFAGQDLEATAAARAHLGDFPPSSPCFALLKDGQVVHFTPRHMIEGRDPQSIAYDLVSAFDEHCK